MSRLVDVECEASEVKQKQKQQILVCEVCNIQLNSSTQAQIHYNGKTHQRRIRQANRAKSSGGARNSMGSPAQGGGLLTSLPVQPQMDLKHVLPIRVNCSSPLSLLPNFNMDPVQKAVISHTFSIAQSLKKPQIITCNICHLRFNSTNQAEAHYKGHKHARKLKAINRLKNKQRILGKSVWRVRERKEPIPGEMENSNGKDSSLSERTAPICSSQASKPEDDSVQGISVTLMPVSHTSVSKSESKCFPESSISVPRAKLKGLWDSESIVKGNRNRRKCSRSLQCAVCKVTVNSGSQLEDHYKGSKHRLMLGGHCMLSRKRGGKEDPSCATPRLHVNSASTKLSHHCNVCDIDVNSEAQLQQHMRSRRHRDRATGKSLHTKFSPYINNSAHSMLTTKLTLQKQLAKTVTSSFLTSGLSPVAMATGTLSPSHVHLPAPLFQAPLFSYTLFRPAPGPFRATHGPVIFCPY
ncbi:zinc finger protein 385B-like isoform X3 [Tachysurus fulvidraco]|nr:zinc finger protein 385B-like isoform X3 [Tachysurus fulvidraco]XP_027032652.2 zinc finger protein 385B-like isoform X3 [Tachysurus fulvidraco]XP_027032653.2 zinc finger protein 385B-like isoform X3 [Tachysurus fulvidraco]